jgi:hypothetical protein
VVAGGEMDLEIELRKAALLARMVAGSASLGATRPSSLTLFAGLESIASRHADELKDASEQKRGERKAQVNRRAGAGERHVNIKDQCLLDYKHSCPSCCTASFEDILMLVIAIK